VEFREIEHQTKVWSSNLRFPGGQSATQLCLFGIARGGVRAGGGAGVVCGAVSPATENEQTVKEGEDLSSRTVRLRNWLARTETIDRASVSMPATLRR